MRRSRSPHVSHVTRADDEGNGPPEFMCHMWMHERPPPMVVGQRGVGEEKRREESGSSKNPPTCRHVTGGSFSI